jgi:hypothetical protein
MAVQPETQGAVAPIAPRRKSALPALAWAGIIGPLLFTVVFLAQEALRRGEYDPLAEPVSALEAGPHGWIQRLNFLVFGLLTMAHAIGLHRGMRPAQGGWIGPALLFFTGIGTLMSTAFPWREDAAGVAYAPVGHIVGGMIFFLGSPAALVVLSRRMRHDPSWLSLAGYTLGLGVVLFALAVVGTVFVRPDTAPLHDWAGLYQRIMIVAVLFPCRVALGVRLLSNTRPATRPASNSGRHGHQTRSNRSRFMTLFHAATKSRTNFSFASSHA